MSKVKTRTQESNFSILQVVTTSVYFAQNTYQLTINDYNIYNKNITKRLKHLKKDTINSSARRVGDAGVYLFGPALVPLDGDILNNPWKNIIENKESLKAKEDNHLDNP